MLFYSTELRFLHLRLLIVLIFNFSSILHFIFSICHVHSHIQDQYEFIQRSCCFFLLQYFKIVAVVCWFRLLWCVSGPLAPSFDFQQTLSDTAAVCCSHWNGSCFSYSMQKTVKVVGGEKHLNPTIGAKTRRCISVTSSGGGLSSFCDCALLSSTTLVCTADG